MPIASPNTLISENPLCFRKLLNAILIQFLIMAVCCTGNTSGSLVEKVVQWICPQNSAISVESECQHIEVVLSVIVFAYVHLLFVYERVRSVPVQAWHSRTTQKRLSVLILHRKPLWQLLFLAIFCFPYFRPSLYPASDFRFYFSLHDHTPLLAS